MLSEVGGRGASADGRAVSCDGWGESYEGRTGSDGCLYDSDACEPVNYSLIKFSQS
jgi:hypothetical protein